MDTAARKRRIVHTRKHTAIVMTVVLTFLAGCSMPTKRPLKPRTPIEQLLISEAIQGAMKDLAMDAERRGAKIYLDMTGLTDEQEYLAQVLRGWLGQQGFQMFKSVDDADYRALLVVQSLGTQQAIRFFGMPAAHSAWLPIALPELALYKKNREEGYARFYFDLFDAKTDKYLRSTREYEGVAVHTKYTYLLVFDREVSDLEDEVRGSVDLTDSGEY